MKALGRVASRLVRLSTSPLRSWPSFFIIGAQKSGTTSLYTYLSSHPQVIPASRKEVHYFDLNFHRGLSWYRAHFPLSRRMRVGAITGEASPYYLFHPEVPARLRSLVPDALLIALLRDPVDRAYSHYQHEVRKGRETASLAEAFNRELVYGASPKGDEHRRRSYLARGLYGEQLERWLDCFPMEQMLVIRAEDMFAAPANVYGRVLAFLGVKAWIPSGFQAGNVGKYPALEPPVAEALSAFFREDQWKLRQLFGEDLRWDLREGRDDA